jgi:hypothetical protein
MQRHPVKHELLSYAECHVGGRPIPADLGGHVARCQSCSAEVKGMVATLRVASKAAGLEPSRDFTNRVLMAAKQERIVTRRNRSRMRSALAVAKMAGYAATLLFVSAVWFSVASSDAAPGAVTPRVDAVPQVAQATPSPEEMRIAAAQAETFAAAALGAMDGRPSSLWELQQRREAAALNADLMEVLSALEKNPGLARASNLMTTTLQRQANNWKALYLGEQSL